jgi:hypothetical protein
MLRTRRTFRVFASPVRTRALILLLIPTAGLSVSCENYREKRLHSWTVHGKLQRNPVGLVGGYYKNRSTQPFPRELLWFWLTRRPSEPSDLVHITVDSEARKLHATLIRDDTEVDRTALRYREDKFHLRLEDRHFWHLERFPLVTAVSRVQYWVGRSQDGLSLYTNVATSGVIVVLFMQGGDGPGFSFTFEQDQR